jgi:serine/threonine protein kinase
VSRKKLGKYEIIDRIGRGGMAEVYRGYHVALDRYVAIKLLHPFLADDPEFKDRFENEARNVAKLKHPNIVQVYDFEYDAEGDSYYMVMEMINGPTLKDRLFDLSSSGERFSIAEAIRITKNAAEALAYAHQRSMIHRDVKPANLMLDDDQRVVLTDFGIAKIVTGAQFTASGGMVGTPAYMAPEQGLGEPGDERSDIYSLGVILYQLVTGRLPFDADTPLAIILKHVNEPVPSPSQFVRDMPEDLEHIICKALAKEPENRYQTAAQMAEDLAKLDATGTRYPAAPLSVGRPAPYETDPVAPTPEQRARLLEAAPPSIVAPPVDSSPTPLPGTHGRLRPVWVLGLAVSLILITSLGLISFGKEDTPFGSLFGSSNNLAGADQTQTALALANTATAAAATTPPPEPTEIVVRNTSTPTVTRSPSPTASASPSETPTLTPTETPSPTQTNTPEPTTTPSPDMTGTALYHFFETQAAASPTPNMTQTLAACDLEYIVVQPERYNQPPSASDVNSPRLVPFNREFSFEIVFRNTGSCAWPEGARLTYNADLTDNPGDLVNLAPLENACTPQEIRPGLNFATQEQSNFYLENPVEITKESEALVFTGTAPDLFGCYYSVWDLLYPNSNVPIGRPLVLTIRVWGSQ